MSVSLIKNYLLNFLRSYDGLKASQNHQLSENIQTIFADEDAESILQTVASLSPEAVYRTQEDSALNPNKLKKGSIVLWQNEAFETLTGMILNDLTQNNGKLDVRVFHENAPTVQSLLVSDLKNLQNFEDMKLKGVWEIRKLAYISSPANIMERYYPDLPPVPAVAGVYILGDKADRLLSLLNEICGPNYILDANTGRLNFVDENNLSPFDELVRPYITGIYNATGLFEPIPIYPILNEPYSIDVLDKDQTLEHAYKYKIPIDDFFTSYVNLNFLENIQNVGTESGGRSAFIGKSFYHWLIERALTNNYWQKVLERNHSKPDYEDKHLLALKSEKKAIIAILGDA